MDDQTETQPGPEDFSWRQLFLRDLAEVHLLIDFISGRADKSLSGLKGLQIFAEGKLVTTDSSIQVVEEISKIAFPPTVDLGTSAEQAALLHQAKDRLNYLADPAKGLTVAFTQMFAGLTSTGGGRRGHSGPGPGGRGGRPPSSFFAARTAYPNLESQARRFSRFYGVLPTFAVAVVMLIVYLNWDINVTSTVLQQISVADSDYAKLFQADKSFVPAIEDCQALVPAATRPSPTQPVKPASTKPGKHAPAPGITVDPAAAGHRLICDQADALYAERRVGRDNLRKLMIQPLYFLHPVALTVRFFAQEQVIAHPAPNESLSNAAIRASTSSASQKSGLEELAIAVVTGLNNIIVPTLFGLLGTLVSVLRSITTKMRESTLAPRDYQISRISIFLGMSAGLTVGLFFNPVDPNGTITKSLGGTISVSAASLSFLAGVGAEAFFTFLDGLIDRLFPKTRPAPPKP